MAVQGDSDEDRLERLLGSWHGSGVVNRSGLYGSNCFEQASQVTLRLEADGSLVQVRPTCFFTKPFSSHIERDVMQMILRFVISQHGILSPNGDAEGR